MATAPTPTSTGGADTEIVWFGFDLANRKNYFTLYLGGISSALFLIIFILAFFRKRTHPVVIQLARPESDAHVHEYIVEIKTSYKRTTWKLFEPEFESALLQALFVLPTGAGLTDGAKVALELFGAFCRTTRFILSQTYMKQKILKRAHCDIFVVYAPMDMGEVQMIRLTLFNLSGAHEAAWWPCYIGVIKSTTREQWGCNIDEPLSAFQMKVKTFRLVKGFREEFSFFKVILQNHQWASPFFNPQRFGAYTTFANILFFFFSQTTLLTCTMSAFILAHQFLGKMISGDFFNQFFKDIFPYTQITAAVTSAILQQMEVLLHNIRPSPSVKAKRLWRGLWHNKYPGNVLQCDINYNWDLTPSEFQVLEKQFTSTTSLSSIDSSEEETDSSLESSESGDVDIPAPAKPTVMRDAALRMLRYCVRLSKRSYTHARKPAEQIQTNLEIELGNNPIVYTGSKAVPGTTLVTLTVPLPRAYCQFCLWVKHFTVRGEDLADYFFSLSHHMRRCITALRATKETKVVIRIMIICTNQWLASVMSRLLREIDRRMDAEGLDKEGVGLLLHEGLLSEQSNLWFAETGHLTGPLAGTPKETTSHLVSTTYFAIMRQIVSMWKSSHVGVRSILRRPHEEIAPSRVHPKGVKWDTKVYKKKILRLTDLVEIMAAADEGTPAPDEVPVSVSVTPDAGSLAASPPEPAPAAPENKNTSHLSAMERVPARNLSNSSSKAEEEGIGADVGETFSAPSEMTTVRCRNETRIEETQTGGPQTCPAAVSPAQVQIETKPLLIHASEPTSSGTGLGHDENGKQKLCKTLPTSVRTRWVTSTDSDIKAATESGGHRMNKSPDSDDGRNKSNSSVYSESSDSEAESAPVVVETLLLPGHQPASNADARPLTRTESGVRARKKLSKEEGGQMPFHRTRAERGSERTSRRRGGRATTRNRSNSHILGSDGLRNRCNSNTKPKPQVSMAGQSNVTGKMAKLFKKKVLNVAGPSVLMRLCQKFESLANVVKYEVTKGRTTCCCCDRLLCQTYAVMYTQLKYYGYKLVYHLVAHNMMRRDASSHELAAITQRVREMEQYVNSFIVNHARLLETMGKPYNKEVIDRLRKEEEAIAKGLAVSHSYGSLDSGMNLNVSANPAVKTTSSDRVPEEKEENDEEDEKCQRYEAHRFDKRLSHHGIIERWTHATYPFADIVYPPVRLKWPPIKLTVTSPSALMMETDVDTTKSAEVVGQEGNVESEVDILYSPSRDTVPLALVKPRGSNVDRTADRMPSGRSRGQLLTKVVRTSLDELKRETGWLLGLKESLAGVIAFARIDIAEELRDPLKIAVRQFTHALLIMFYEGLLPKPDEENFVVTADDIRQRRKRVSSNRTPGLFDMTENNDPGYDLNFLDFVVVKLCERWEMAKVEMQYLPTLVYLSRCLTMSNLNRHCMENLEGAMLSKDTGDLGMTLTTMTHVHEVEHSVAMMVNEVMALTLVYVVPETLKAITDISGKLRNEDERVTYVCEKVTVLEHQVRHKLARRLTESSSRQVQNTLLALDERQEKINKKQTKMMNKLRSLVEEDDYYCQISSKELEPIKQELKQIRNVVDTLQRIERFQSARSVSKYARKTRTLEDLQVKDTISAMTDIRSKETEYTARQYAEVEWVVTGEMMKYFPSIIMNLAMVFMFLGTVVNLFVVIVIGAGFSPFHVGQWFGLHTLGLVMVILVCEPFKCLWYYDFGWQQPLPHHAHEHSHRQPV